MALTKRFIEQPITNVFGEVIGMSTRPSSAQLRKFEEFASQIESNFGLDMKNYRDTFTNKMDDDGREGFLTTLEKMLPKYIHND